MRRLLPEILSQTGNRTRRIDVLDARIEELQEQRDAARRKRDAYKEQRDRLRGGGAIFGAVPSGKPSYYMARQVGLAYLQIPKAACSTIKAALLHYTNPELYASKIDAAESDLPALQALHHEGHLEESEDPGDCLRFTFVRHPFDRFLSFFHNFFVDGVKLQDGALVDELNEELEPFGLVATMGFGEFSEAVFGRPYDKQNPHVKRQVDLILGSGELAVDFIGRLEFLERDLNRLTAGIDAPPPKLGRLNQSSHKDWHHSELLGPEVVKKLTEFYRDDLAYFGFSAEH
ncbi:MAG: sulfotransferase family 2 domain-containing protein [Verrucomicrobiales bacterium]